METWVNSETLYEGKIVTLKRGRVRLDDGREAIREVVEHNGGVVIAPRVGDSVVLVRQYRIAIGKELLELPAGKLEGAEEPLERGGAGRSFFLWPPGWPAPRGWPSALR